MYALLISSMATLAYAAAPTAAAPTLPPTTKQPTLPPPTPMPTPVECAICFASAHEQCVEDVGVNPHCECFPGFRRDNAGACVENEDHINTSLLPPAIQGKSEFLTFDFIVTTMGPRELHCELLTDPNTGHYKYGEEIVKVTGVVTHAKVSLTMELTNHITENVVLLSCFLTYYGGNYDTRTDLEIATMSVIGASGIYDLVDSSSLTRSLDPAPVGTTYSVSLTASAKGPRDLHLDLIYIDDNGAESTAGYVKINIANVAPITAYPMTFKTTKELKLHDRAFWSSYLTPPGMTYRDVVANGWGDRVDVTVGPPLQPTTMPTASLPPSTARPTAQPTSVPPQGPTSSPTDHTGHVPGSPTDSSSQDSTRGGGSAPADGMDGGLIALIVVAVLVVVGGLGFAAYKKTQKKPTSYDDMTLNGEAKYDNM